MQTYHNIDSGGFDIGQFPGKTKEEMFKLCLSIPYAVGWNSNNWLKYHINSVKTNSPGSTLYVVSKPFRQLSVKKLPSIWCINLERRLDRKVGMQTKEWKIIQEMPNDKSTNSSLINFFTAVDGKQLTMTKEIKTLFKGNDFNYRRGVVGAALSHYNLWKQLLKSKELSYLIVEDDVEFANNFMAKYSHAMANIELIDPEWDILYLGFSLYERKQYENELWNDKLPHVIPFPTNLCIGAGFFGYVVSRRGATKLINYIGQNGITRAIDCIPIYLPGMRRYSMMPNIIQTPCFSAENQNVDTDIQTDYNVLNE